MGRFSVEDTSERIIAIVQALQTLTQSLFIGRPVEGGSREMVIGRGAHGAVALDRFVASVNTVLVLAVRSQREAGHKPGR